MGRRDNGRLCVTDAAGRQEPDLSASYWANWFATDSSRPDQESCWTFRTLPRWERKKQQTKHKPDLSVFIGLFQHSSAHVQSAFF